MESPNWLVGIATVIIFYAIGIACIVWPERIQRHALKYYDGKSFLEKLNPFFDWMKTPSYIVYLKVMGGFITALATLLLALFLLSTR
jgi:hypothetical protein